MKQLLSLFSPEFVCGEVTEAFDWSVIEIRFDLLDSDFRNWLKVGSFGEVASDPRILVFDTAFLPRFIGITEVGIELEKFLDRFIAGELGTVIEWTRSPQWRWNGEEDLKKSFANSFGLQIWHLFDKAPA